MALSFTDAQMQMIRDASLPLDRFIRSAFLESVAVYFRGQTEVGDGELSRCLRELQHGFLNYPRTNRGARSHYGGTFNRT
jgi:hypothetical protein